MESENRLPSLKELANESEVAVRKDAFNLLMNQEPPKAWIKLHPFAKDVKYITINRVETLLTQIFQEWKVEVIDYSALFNSVSVHIRLHYRHPITELWQHQDGLGAMDVQTKKGESASNLAAINTNAVMKALPAAKSYAIKDAAEHLGKLFGRDLNRKDTAAFTTQYADQESLNDILKKDDERNNQGHSQD